MTGKGAPQSGTRIHARGTDGGIYYGATYTAVGEAEQVAQSRLAPALQGPPFWQVLVECDAPCGTDDSFAGPAGECRHYFLLSPDCWEAAS